MGEREGEEWRWDCRAELAFHFLLTFTKISKDEKAGKEFGKSVTR